MNPQAQYSWGKELQRRNIGPAPISRREASAKKVAKQIRAVLDQPDIRRHAQAAGDAMRKENGVAAAVIDSKTRRRFEASERVRRERGLLL